MLRYQSGDVAAFDQIYARHKDALYRYLLRQCKNAGSAEELFQDIWLNLIRTRHRYRVQARFSTYLYRLAHNRLVDHYRRRRVIGSEGIDPEQLAAAEGQQPDCIEDRRRQAERLQQALDRLPAEQREAFLLRAEGGLALDEIATVTSVPRETAKSRLRYAVTRLRRMLEEDP